MGTTGRTGKETKAISKSWVLADRYLTLMDSWRHGVGSGGKGRNDLELICCNLE